MFDIILFCMIFQVNFPIIWYDFPGYVYRLVLFP